jgi:excinuclease ABC subunit A
MENRIYVKGAKENNLKNIDVSVPKNTLTVFTGISGSGKSSLAFDTIFAEGQRRYIESLSSYARMFLGQMEKPDIEYIEGLSPAVAIDQKTTSHNPRSTVGTVTEIYDYLRLLYARIGHPHCPICGKEIVHRTVDEIVDSITERGGKVQIMAPVVRGRKGEYQKLLEGFKKSGYARFRVDGINYTFEDEINLDKNLKHAISVVIDRLVLKDNIGRRLTDSVETALKLAEGLVTADFDGEEVLYSTKYSCPDCDISIEELTPRLFSFNNPYGACPECAGLGYKSEIDINLVISDWNKSINEGALSALAGWNLDTGRVSEMQYKALSKSYNFSLDTPIGELPENIRNILFYGNDGDRIEMHYNSRSFSGIFSQSFEGVVNNLTRRYRDTQSEAVKRDIEKFMRNTPCPVCGGKRLKPEALAVTVGGKNIVELSELPIRHADAFLAELPLTETEMLIARRILKEIRARIRFLVDVGLDYLTLSRTAMSLSGGESQRIRLATQIGSGLSGVLYILDEPSIGLHQKDNERLLESLKGLRDLGNTLIVVEHDEDTIRNADYVVDIGPGAGVHGGKLVAAGTVGEIMACDESITGKYLSGELKIDVPRTRKIPDGRFLTVTGAAQNNLKNIDVNIPVGLFTAVTGVSGSGKSSLINEIVYPVLGRKLNGARLQEGTYTDFSGTDYFDKVINIDQSPIGRTPRSNPATYTGVFTYIRELFAATPDAKTRGYGSGRFSFNISGGRCENCSGDGIIKIEMHFLPDVYVPCDTCKGNRYNRETLDVKYKGKSIADVLNMTVEEACGFFANLPRIYNKIKTLYDVGLGYIRLGQSSTTLSGGEAQRVKLATELSKRGTGRTVYILDEPTTGLHPYDVDKLLKILQRFAEAGNTVIVIEHNLDVIKVADYIIDLGPNGGDGGGYIVAQGSPEAVSAVHDSYTGQFLKRILK